jgi:hypothetical protein
MRFREFKLETIDPNAISAKDSLDPGEELVKPQLYPKVGKKVEKTPLYPKVGFRVKIPANEYISTDVADIQKVLIALGYNIGKTGPKGDGVDGVNGQLTRSAIGKFQEDQGLRLRDKKIGPETVDALNQEIAARQLHLAHSNESELDPHAKRVLNKDNASGEKVSDADIADIHDPEFSTKLKEVAKKLGVQWHDLWKVIRFESKGGKPSAENPYTSATGLIQFMPDTAIGLGTTVGDLKSMSAVDQLDYVLKFYKTMRLKAGSGAAQMYLKTIAPAYAYKDDDFELGKKGAHKEFLPGMKGSMGAFYNQNGVFQNKSTGTITVGDIKNVFNSRS